MQWRRSCHVVELSRADALKALIPEQVSFDGGHVWSQQDANKFHYHTAPTLEYAVPSAAPLTGGTIITVYAAMNHTFVSLPRLQVQKTLS